MTEVTTVIPWSGRVFYSQVLHGPGPSRGSVINHLLPLGPTHSAKQTGVDILLLYKSYLLETQGTSSLCTMNLDKFESLLPIKNLKIDSNYVFGSVMFNHFY